MRLRKIKLAGFKSFVDPTTLILSSNLIGVVGPNGCGKSNIIDAVRWVMGESSAKHLRGDSMTDVIFNGSNARKPVGRASIELLFDNTDGRLGGEYAQYAEISIKRMVSRDGASVYYLNGSKCRRRDITDIFLGTGLGPRSYAIIEQGMISRLVEAKPDELRIFIEEAAGVSKYKERRRETENRMHHTQENLLRLSDILEELGKQLNRLQRQAKTAEKFRTLKQEERLGKAQLQALKWKALNENIKDQEGHITEQELLYEKRLAKLRNIELETEQSLTKQVDATDEFNQVQEKYYTIGAQIARLEQTIAHTKETRTQQQQDLSEVDQALSESYSHLDMDQRQIDDLRSILQQSEPRMEEAEMAERESGSMYSIAEQAMNEWQKGWETFNLQCSELQNNIEVERLKISHKDESLAQIQLRIDKLHEEKNNFSLGKDQNNLPSDIQNLKDNLYENELVIDELKQQVGTVILQINECRDKQKGIISRLDETKDIYQKSNGRLSSLELLQQIAMGSEREKITDWLEENGLYQVSYLAQNISVEEEWQRAVEIVLGNHLEAIKVEDVSKFILKINALTQSSLGLIDGKSAPEYNDNAQLNLLSEKIETQLSLGGILRGIYTADSLEHAIEIQPVLKTFESVITKEGIWIGPSWVRIANEVDQKTGMLKREQEILQLKSQIETSIIQKTDLERELEDNQNLLVELEQDRDRVQNEYNNSERTCSEIKSLVSSKQIQWDHIRTRKEEIDKEVESLNQQIQKITQNLHGARSDLEIKISELEVKTQQRELLTLERDQLRGSLESSREQAKIDRTLAHEISLQIQTTRAALTSTLNSLERVQNQLGTYKHRSEELNKSIAQSEAPMHDMSLELELLLESRITIENELSEKRRIAENIEHRIRDLNQERNHVEQNTLEVRSDMDKTKMAWQEVRVRCQTLQERLQESGFEIETLIREMPEEANIEEWSEKIEKVDQRIQRLGPINLAAIDEYQEHQQRKEYLDSQQADLLEALTTLENAILKIDKETRTKFKETYEKINQSFKERFPRLFGGGQAYLELLGDDLLTTGVAVMARPPGKRNSTIHLLSGGEKALTAIALVFAIFELNPSPFCMLDEVDAPLDDANVNRYCDVVSEMSEKIQFIFITHNKVTMEMANHLHGVTMHEPGVSRLVSVDVEAAAKLVAM